MNPITFAANGTFLKIQPPGILAVDKDGAGYPRTVAVSAGNAPVASGGLTLSVDPNGGFSASASCTPTAPATSCPYTFTYYAQNSQGTVSSGSATVTINFAPATGLAVTVLDGKDVLAAKTDPTITPSVITDYRWIIEEDRTFYVNPNCTTNPPADCTNATASATEPGACGHGMGGAPVRCTITPPATTCSFPTTASPLTVLTQPDPYPPSKLSVFVFEDDFPLNGEHDGGGGIDVIASQESGLGGFNITLFDDAG